MGTHPIFESDFDCLTEKMANQILVVGVSGAGKTCLIRRLEDPNTTDWSTIPTVGAQPTKVQNFIFQEVGGQLQPLWTTYAQEAKGIICVKSNCRSCYCRSRIKSFRFPSNDYLLPIGDMFSKCKNVSLCLLPK